MEGKLESNVVKFIHESSMAVAAYHQEMFNEDTLCECTERGINSPIEQILYCSLKHVRALSGINEPDQIGDYTIGLGIYPQHEIGRYRVDFLVSFGRICSGIKEGMQYYKEVVVECDSQQFHERTEKERRYEKARDRFLISKGYTAFHFTGTEIIKEPLRVASEIIAHLLGTKPDRLPSNVSEL